VEAMMSRPGGANPNGIAGNTSYAVLPKVQPQIYFL
jgi:hypothetical protein